MTILEEKKRLRKEISEKIKLLSEEQKNKESLLCSEKIISLDAFNSSDYVLSYMSMKNELCADLVNRHAVSDGKKLFLPRVINETGVMEFYSSAFDFKTDAPGGEFESGSWGILEPRADEKNLLVPENISSGKNVFVIVPGAAFTESGERLGRGRAFYDRYLLRLKNASEKNGFHVITVGAGFSVQLVDSVPCESTDILLDYVCCPPVCQL